MQEGIFRSAFALRDYGVTCGWRVTGGEWLVASGWWLVASGWWRVTGGEWLVASGWWRVAGGEWLVASDCRGWRRLRRRILLPLFFVLCFTSTAQRLWVARNFLCDFF